MDRLYPQLLPSEGTCTIGGNLSTNAGGTAALAHGIARSHALGIEVVLADGRVLHNLNKLKKDNTGYDLKNLFIGAEGTLGVITAAVLRLVPRPRAVETAFVGVPSPEAALDLLGLATERTAGGVTSFELMLRIGIELVLRHGAGCRDPLPEKHPWYVLIELSSAGPLRLARGDGGDPGRGPGARPHRGRHHRRQSRAGAKCSGASANCSARCSGMKAARSSMTSRCRSRRCRPSSARPAPPSSSSIPGSRPLPFGHLGDGNIHYNVAQPVGADKADFLKRWDEVNAVVFDVVAKHGGSISAEHGIGVIKRDLLPKVKDPVAFELMRTLKRTLDPKGILNPGKVL